LTKEVSGEGLGGIRMRPVLCDTLSVLLPTEQDTLLLRACLRADDAGREAWCAWLERIGDPREELVHRRPMLIQFLPLLHLATTRYGVEVQSDLAFYLRAAYFREELRSQSYRNILHKVLRTLRDAGIDFTVLKGAALAGTVYDDWALRHCHDIDLLVDETSFTPASRTLQNAGAGRPCAPPGMHDRHVRLLHDSGLPIELHADLFRLPFYQGQTHLMLERRRLREIVGLPVHVLTSSDSLLHVCGHASYSESPASLRWVADAWSIVAKCADLDWDAFVDTASRTKLSLPMYVLLEYLFASLGAAIPLSVLQSLARDAKHVGTAAREAALLGMRGKHHRLRAATRAWRSRAFLLRWRLLPSPSYLRWTYGVQSQSGVLLLYLVRVMRHVVRRTRLVLERFGPVRRARAIPLEGSCDE
jgi:hypothetical protein